MLIKALILLVGLSTAYTLKCYVCAGKDCTTMTCTAPTDKCSSVEKDGLVYKACLPSDLCISPISCCEKDLCNGTVPTGPSVVLLLLASAIFSLFL